MFTTNCTDGFSGYLTRSGNDMKIVDRAVKKVYRFNCPNCQSRLEGESKEFEDIGGKISKFFCPVCKKDRYITWSDLRKKRSMRARIRNNYNSLYERRVD